MVDTHALSVAPDAKQVGRLMRQASLASMSVAIVLVVAKGAAWLVTDSVGMLSSLIDSRARPGELDDHLPRHPPGADPGR